MTPEDRLTLKLDTLRGLIESGIPLDSFVGDTYALAHDIATRHVQDLDYRDRCDGCLLPWPCADVLAAWRWAA